MPKQQDPFKRLFAVLKMPRGKVAVKTGSPYSMYSPPFDLKIRKK